MSSLVLTTPLSSLHGLSPRFLKRFEHLGIRTIRDLLWHFPFRYEDFSQIYAIADLEPGQEATVQGVIKTIELRRSWQRRMVIVEAEIADETGEIRAIWFNQPYVKNVLRTGRRANFSGKVTHSDGGLYLSHPTYELVGAGETKHTARLVPIYPETRGLTSKGIRMLVQPILKSLDGLEEWIPDRILRAYRFPELTQALHDVHFPNEIQDALAAKRRFAFEDLFLLQLYHAREKNELAKEKAPAVHVEIDVIKKILGELPFSLTFSQKKSLWEILQDMEKPHPMNRLLQGDVGSGKTVVAAVAALAAARCGFQTAFMAPTEVLAHQHFRTLEKLFGTVMSADQPVVGLLTGSEAKILYATDMITDTKKTDLTKRIGRGEVTIIVGTHALISSSAPKRSSEGREKSLSFSNLGLVIVDEQHRFGVRQRAELTHQAMLPHFLSMSATPIPRTLMLTMFGDLNISAITELPAGRKTVITKVVAPENRPKAYAFIRGEIRKGRQAFVICPRIEPNEETKNEKLEMRNWKDRIKLETKSVKEEYEKLSKQVFPDLRVGMLHGQLKAKEKGRIMGEFKAGTIDVLVSTSVIEVGVDVPNATIMMIEGSDRFGLAQLYQFRGRVGRGVHQSFCFLFTDSNGKTVQGRLKAIVNAKNGFELAEEDLKIRGPGEFLGQKQTGLPDVSMRGLGDVELIKTSRAAALEVLQKDSALNYAPLLLEKLEEFKQRIHLE